MYTFVVELVGFVSLARKRYTVCFCALGLGLGLGLNLKGQDCSTTNGAIQNNSAAELSMGTIYLFHPAGSIPVETFSCKRYGNGSDNGASPALLTAVCQQTTGAQYHFRNSTALSTKTIVSRNRGP